MCKSKVDFDLWNWSSLFRSLRINMSRSLLIDFLFAGLTNYHVKRLSSGPFTALWILYIAGTGAHKYKEIHFLSKFRNDVHRLDKNKDWSPNLSKAKLKLHHNSGGHLLISFNIFFGILSLSLSLCLDVKLPLSLSSIMKIEYLFLSYYLVWK